MPLSKNKKGAGPRDESPEAGPSRKDKYSSDEDDEATHKKGDKHHSSKMSKQCGMSKKSPGISKQMGGHGTHNKPAELFRKDLISAMKLADTEILYEDEYVVISDPWRQEWEKGVQVPVNEEEIPVLSIIDVQKSDKGVDFKMPLRKYMHEKNDETYQSTVHELTGMQELAEQIVRYDLDDQDVSWLDLVNGDREEMGLQVINEWNLERMIEELENQCYVKTNAVKKTEEGLGIEYDEDIACDVCRMLESEDTNEMVFCDGCDICVHQACYGIQTIPVGSWLCRICALGIKPMCLLCPKRGGAMKSTRSGTKWTHVSCALWIPEVSIGCPEKMEPITKISNIPASRWALVCCLCKERVGACIQCSVKQCKTAFHVTCGFAHNLDMKTILDDTDELDGIHLRAYCPKHTKNRNASDSESPKKDEEEEDEADNENDVNEAEMAKQRAEKLKQLDEEFYTLIDTGEIASKFYIPEEAVDIVAEYWKLKRKVNNNKPLITPKMEEEDQMQKQQKDSLSARMKMFVHLRQDLERARNLCYMISKREKTKKQLFNLNESVFRSQVLVLTDSNSDLSAREADKIRQAYKFNSLYCTLNSTWSKDSKTPRKNLFTLENLKTPKDFSEGDSESNMKEENFKSKKDFNPSSGVTIKKEPSIDSNSGATEDSSSVKRLREHLFSVEGFKVQSDTTADSSEDEFMSCDDGLKSKTDSVQMSRLGKVKAEEIETNDTEDNKVEEKKLVQTDTKNKKNTGSDLKMRLTSILQSKSLMQKQDKSSDLESFNQVLQVVVDNSDSEVFTDSNTDFASPEDQPRNLFDKFEMKKSFSGTPDLSSPDMPRSSKSSKRRKRRKGFGCYKRKKHEFSNSPSDQSSLSSNSLKQETLFSIDNDSRSVSADCSSLLSDHTEREKSIISPTSASEASGSVNNEKYSDLDERSHNPFKLRKSKKRSHADRDALSPRHVKSLRSSSTQKTPKMSPSPRVDPVNAYRTVDGDIYVPSGTIQVTERTIVLDNPEEEKTRVQGKLRLKKKPNSPIKGVVSYEVVNNDFSDSAPVTKCDVRSDDTVEDKTDDTNGSKDNDHLEGIHQPPDSHENDSSVLLSSPQKLREKNFKSETKHGKLLSNSTDNVTKVIRDCGEESNKKDSHDIIMVNSSPDKEKGSRRSLRSVAVKSGYSSDENFVPASEMPKSPAVDRSQRPHRQRTSRRLHTDTDGGDSDSVHSSSPHRNCSHRHNSSPIVKRNPFPNRPELHVLLDSGKLVVKDSVKKQVGDHLSRMLKRRGRWGRGFEPNQLTIDSFVKPVKNSDNVFANLDSKTDREMYKSSVSSHDLRTSSSGQLNDVTQKSTDSLVSSSLSLNLTANGNIFGAHSSPRRLNNNPSAKTRSSNAESKGDLVFGEVPSASLQASFKEVSTRSPLREEVKTPSKCDPSVLNNDCMDVSRNYRCHSPLSSESSEASSRNPMADSRESTPRRTARNRITENSQSPIAPGRLRNRDALVKSTPYKSS